jgi:hypothetical protein
MSRPMLGLGRLAVDVTLLAAKEEIPVPHTSILSRSRANTAPFMPDAIAVEDYLPARAATELSGARALLLAVIEGAVDDVQKYGRWRERKAGALARDALAWIESDATDPYTFLFTCDVLGLEPSCIRAGVRRSLAPPLPPDDVPAPTPVAPTWTPHRLRALRYRLGWSQARMGEALGLSQSNAGVLERAARGEVPVRFHAVLDGLDVGVAS